MEHIKEANKILSKYGLKFEKEVSASEAYNMLGKDPFAQVYAFQVFLKEVCKICASGDNIYVGSWTEFSTNQLIAINDPRTEKIGIYSNKEKFPRKYFTFFVAKEIEKERKKESCKNLCPHCGKCTMEKKETIPDTEEGRINALLAKMNKPLKLVRIIDREETACLLFNDKNTKVLAYDKIDYWISGEVSLKSNESKRSLKLCGRMSYGFKYFPKYVCCPDNRNFEVCLRMDIKDRDHIIFFLAEEA